MTTSLALAAHPLDKDSLDHLAERLGEYPRVLTLAELRSQALSAMLARLRRERPERLVVAATGPSTPFAAILMAVSLLIPAGRRLEIGADGRLMDLGMPRILRSIASLTWASTGNLVAWVRFAAETMLLYRRPRQIARVQGNGVLYLQAALAHGATIGGSVAHTAGVINGLAELGQPVTVLTTGSPPMLRPEVRVMRLRPLAALGLPAEAGLFRHHYAFVHQARKAVPAKRPGFIYARMVTDSLAAVMMSRRLGVPLVLEYNGSEVWIARNWGRRLRFEATAARCEAVNLHHAHVVVTISDALRDDLLERGVPPERIIVHPNAVDPAVFDPARFSTTEIGSLRAHLGLAPDALVFGFVGTFGRWHGAEILSQAVAVLTSHHRDWLDRNHIHFLLVGDGITRAEAEAAVREAGAEPYVTFAGLVPQAEAPLYLAAMDILVSPHVGNQDGTRFFGSPTKLFEYLSMGRPVLASDLDQIGALLANQLCARLLPPGDAVMLADACVAAAEDATWRKAAGPAARELALERFTWTRHVQAVLAGLTRACP